jgi:predicted negative regulator of RcsB-dependent stress response
VQYTLGRWAESRQSLRKSIRLAEEVGSTFAEVLGAQRLALLETDTGQYEPARRRLLRSLDQARASDNSMVREHSLTRILATLVTNRLQANDLPAAVEHLAAGFAALEERELCVSCDVLLYPAAVQAYLALGDLKQAEWASEKASETAATFRSPSWIAVSRYLRGIVAAALGDPAVASKDLQGADKMFESMEMPYEIAQTEEALGDLAAKGAGEISGEARDHLERAREIYGRLGATPSERRVSEALKRL